METSRIERNTHFQHNTPKTEKTAQFEYFKLLVKEYKDLNSEVVAENWTAC